MFCVGMCDGGRIHVPPPDDGVAWGGGGPFGNGIEEVLPRNGGAPIIEGLN